MTRVCVVGGGGREHALASALRRSAQVVVTPGNLGIPGSTATPAEELDADLFVIGPEVPLVAGLADRLRAQGKLVLGPGADGARLEGSKRWMKELLVRAGVPTARHATFTEAGAALGYLDELGDLFVIKTDGLAAGKGVLVTSDRAEAAADIEAKLSGAAFGDAGRSVVIEEGMTGPELSVFAVCDGRQAVALPAARDHKRLGDGDTGPNTGGMGAFAPVAGIGPDLVDEIMERAVLPTLHQLQADGIDYRGVLYAGMMLTPDGPKVIEYNVRFGDPEAQVVLPLLESDLVDLLASAAEGSLRSDVRVSPDSAVTVVCAVEGYPDAPRTGDPIRGVEEAVAEPGVELFFAGVAEGPEGGLATSGGRVMSVTGRGPDLAAARATANRGLAHLSWPGLHHRTDIAAP
ncbi:MAG: phosphoribosylamine--glycine ligase [Acidimicrobiales bacterium]